jgi:DNA-binding NtrC family response regulator
LNVFPVVLPPLRDRRDSLDELASFFVRLHARGMGKKISGIAASALKALRDYHWPGNIRELQNVIERAVILARGEVTCINLPETITSHRNGSAGEDGGLLKEAERDAIEAALKATAGNRRLAADRLGISRRTLQYRLKEYGLLEGE